MSGGRIGSPVRPSLVSGSVDLWITLRGRAIEGTNMADVVVTPVDEMEDETLMKHLELRHEDDLALRFLPDPDKGTRVLAAPELWRTYHDTMHRLYPCKYEHSHRGAARG